MHLVMKALIWPYRAVFTISQSQWYSAYNSVIHTYSSCLNSKTSPSGKATNVMVFQQGYAASVSRPVRQSWVSGPSFGDKESQQQGTVRQGARLAHCWMQLCRMLYASPNPPCDLHWNGLCPYCSDGTSAVGRRLGEILGIPMRWKMSLFHMVIYCFTALYCQGQVFFNGSIEVYMLDSP